MTRGIGGPGKFTGRPPVSVDLRYTMLVDKRGPDECWPWLGFTNAKGHGQITLPAKDGERRGRSVRAHIYGWERVNGPMAEGMQGNHSCNHGWCQNPAHLYEGTQHDNVQDMIAAGTHHAFGRKPK